MENKWIRAAIPSLLIHCSIGSVYCWSTFKQAIADEIGMSPFAVGWAFSLAIFFLGMSAAFTGRFVERDIHKSSIDSCLFFSVGMIGTGVSIQFLSGPISLIMIYVCYGCIMGVGLGIGYITPVKNLMLWFRDQKGLATGISIMGFGLAKAIATPLMELIQTKMNICSMFYIMGSIYFVMMFIGHKLIKKPEGWVEVTEETDSFKAKEMFSNKTFRVIWLMFYLNIHCGLMIITYEKQLLQSTFNAKSYLPILIAVVPSVTAICNALGRLGYATLSDFLKDRGIVYHIIVGSAIVITYITLLAMKIELPFYQVFVIIFLMIINLGYGGGFSTLPALLDQEFGMKNISKIHGLALSAWAIAGLTGNNLSEIILQYSGLNYIAVLSAISVFLLIEYACVKYIIIGKRMG